MPSSTARSTTRRCSVGLPRTMSPAFPPQPKPISETRNSVFPTCRYSMIVPPYSRSQRDSIPEMADKQKYAQYRRMCTAACPGSYPLTFLPLGTMLPSSQTMNQGFQDMQPGAVSSTLFGFGHVFMFPLPPGEG